MPTIWPFAPLAPVSERLDWNTDILQARASEQRIALRRIPLRSMSLSHVLSEAKTSDAKQIVRETNPNEYQVPHWGQAVRVGAVGVGTDTVVTGNFAATELWIGSEAIVWQADDNYEAVFITAIDETSATLDSVTGTYTDALVMPLLDAAMPDGITVSRDASIWRNISATFQINDNVDAAAFGKVLLYIALDTSLSMDTDVGGGITRLDNAKSALIDTLDYVLETAKESGADIDIKVVGWDSGKTSQTETSVDAAEIASLQTFIDGLTTTSGTDFTKAVEDAPAFFASAAYKKGVIIFVTDGVPSGGTPAVNAQDARDILDTIPTLVETYGINIDLADTTYTAIVDDTDADAVPVVAGNDPADLLAAFQSAVYPTYYEQYRSKDVVNDACVVAGGTFSERVNYDVQSFDNGTANPFYISLRDLVNSRFQMRWQSQDMESIYTTVKWIHTRKGRQKAFWVSTLADDLTIAGNISGTTLPVESFNRTDFPVDLDILSTSGVHYYRRVTAATPSGNIINLTMTSTLSLAEANVVGISFLMCSRFDSDSIEIRHEPTYSSVQIPCIEIPEP